jgi:hypothetical protein
LTGSALRAYAPCGAAGGVNRLGSANAMLDPVFTIDPAFASLYCVVGVPQDIVAGGNNGAVPEPSTWAMLIVGFGMAGTMIRRRRNMALIASRQAAGEIFYYWQTPEVPRA